MRGSCWSRHSACQSSGNEERWRPSIVAGPTPRAPLLPLPQSASCAHADRSRQPKQVDVDWAAVARDMRGLSPHLVAPPAPSPRKIPPRRPREALHAKWPQSGENGPNLSFQLPLQDNHKYSTARAGSWHPFANYLSRVIHFGNVNLAQSESRTPANASLCLSMIVLHIGAETLSLLSSVSLPPATTTSPRGKI